MCHYNLSINISVSHTQQFDTKISGKRPKPVFEKKAESEVVIRMSAGSISTQSNLSKVAIFIINIDQTNE